VTVQSSVRFDPFRDRLSRDIRNDMSRGFVKSLAAASLSSIDELAASLIEGEVQRCHREYVERRLELYRRAFNRIQESGHEVMIQGVILWNLRLFFEMHEVLELAWRHSEGDLKMLLQAMIRAAGVYIKLEYGYSRQAAKLAEKACRALEKSSCMLQGYFAPGQLIAALRSLDPTPPILVVRLHPFQGAGRSDKG
jgi:uncharacterized protein